MKIRLSRFSVLTISLLLIITVVSISAQLFVYKPLVNIFNHFDAAYNSINENSITIIYPLNSMKNIGQSLPERRYTNYTRDIFIEYQHSLVEKQETIVSELDALMAPEIGTPLQNMFIPDRYINFLKQTQINLKFLHDDYVKLGYKDLTIDSTQSQYDKIIEKHTAFEQVFRTNKNEFLTMHANFQDFKESLFFSLYIIILVFALILSFIIIHQMNFQKSLYYKVSTSLNLMSSLKKSPTEHRALFKEEKDIYSHIDSLIQEKTYLSKTKAVLTTHYEMDEFLDALFKEIKPTIGIDRIGVAFIDYDREVIIAEHGVSSNPKLYLGPGFKVKLSHTSLTDLITHPYPLVENDLEAFYAKKPYSSSLNLINKEGLKSNIIIPLVVDHKTIGFLFFSSNEKNHFTPEIVRKSTLIASEISDSLTRSYMIKLLFSQMTNSFSRLVEKKDSETGFHLDRMTLYSKTIAEGLINRQLPDYPVNQQFVLNIEKYAASHDIGKVGVPDAILKKPGRLTDEETVIMRQHVIIGAELLRNIKENLNYFGRHFFETAYNITMYHHEKWDGTGYPNGVSGMDIPLEARIVAVADVFDALTSKRVYKPAFSVEKSGEYSQRRCR